VTTAGKALPRPGEATPGRAARLRHRLTARWCRQRLDRALAGGADPGSSPVLRARAAALRGRREREALASAIYRLLKEARRDRSSFSVRVPIARDAIELNRPQLLALAAELRQAPTVSARGVAAIRLLVTDGSDSPLYHHAAPRSLSTTLSCAGRWL
jgi:hypothetical protein